MTRLVEFFRHSALVVPVLCACGAEPSRASGNTGGTRTDNLGGGLTGQGGAGATAIADANAARLALTGDIVFSVPGGTFVDQVSVELSSGVQGAVVRYTTDGEPPTADSPLYSGPIVLAATTQLRAQSFLGEEPSGRPGAAVYVARSFDVDLDLPIVVLDSYGSGALDPESREYVDVAFLAIAPTGGVASLSAPPAVATPAGFHVRGQSTATFEKTPYRVELRSADGEDLDWPLLGMPSEADWALRGPFADKALIRDAFFYGLGRDMGLQAPRFAYCELYRNLADRPLDSDDYMGVYLMVETIKNQRNRLDLRQLDENDRALPEIAGGYIMKFDWLAAEAPTLACSGGTASCWSDLEVVDPKSPVTEQLAWLTSHVQEFHDVLHSDGFADPVSGYAAYIEVDSFVDHLIINELGREMDAYIRSTYFYKDRDTKLIAGPLWDYNLVFGVGGFFESDRAAGWQYEQQRSPVNTDWYLRLTQDPAFLERVASRWRELRQGLLSDAALEGRIIELATPLANAAARNFARWPNLSTRQVGFFTTPTESTWVGQLQFVRDWLQERVAWLDSQWG